MNLEVTRQPSAMPEPSSDHGTRKAEHASACVKHLGHTIRKYSQSESQVTLSTTRRCKGGAHETDVSLPSALPLAYSHTARDNPWGLIKLERHEAIHPILHLMVGTKSMPSTLHGEAISRSRLATPLTGVGFFSLDGPHEGL